jgi:molybdenum cofactor cytidylyltransferase
VKFGPVPVDAAEGGILAHQVRAGDLALRKSHVLSAADCARLAAAGVEAVTIARLEPGDIGEDEAARRLAEAAGGAGIRMDPAFTGRANLFAEEAGLFVPDKASIDRFNMLDPAITLATLPAYKRVEPGEMVATVKIIPFAVPEATIEAGRVLLGQGGTGHGAKRQNAMRVVPFTPKRIGMLSLRLPGLKESVLDKTVRVMTERLAGLGNTLAFERRLDHRQADLEAALRALDPASYDILVIFGAAAIADRADIIPQALERTGGWIEHFGMPVDPGNLLLVGDFSGKPVIGAPGCARSPRENGFDWVLARLCADLPVKARDIQSLGVGGLLMEIVSRPQPRAGLAEIAEPQDVVAALVLAAGRSTRFGPENKLLAPINGQPMLAHVLDHVRQAGIEPVFVVTGHEAGAVRALVAERATCIANAAYAEGLSTSLRVGLAALPDTIGAVLILLGDMPRVRPETLRKLVATARMSSAKALVPVFEGRWGNPVLVRRTLFPSLSLLHGDQGARKLLEAARESIDEVPVDDPGILADFDTRAALEAGAQPDDQ